MQSEEGGVVAGAPPAVLPRDKKWQGPCPFLVGDLVESRSFTEGYRDAWFLSQVLNVKEERGPAAYDLTLKCVDFDEDEPFQCQLYQTNPGVPDPQWELMVRPPPPSFQRQGSKTHGGVQDGPTYCLRRRYAVGDAVEYLCNCAWWAGRISEISGQYVSVWWRPPPFGEGGEETNISFEALRPAMTWDRGRWSFPGHPEGPLGGLSCPVTLKVGSRIGLRKESGAISGRPGSQKVFKAGPYGVPGKRSGEHPSWARPSAMQLLGATSGRRREKKGLLGKNSGGRSSGQVKAGAQGSLGAKSEAGVKPQRAETSESPNVTRYGRVVKPEILYNTKEPEQSPKKPKRLFPANKRKGTSGDADLPPFSRKALNEALSRERRMEIARNALSAEVSIRDEERLRGALQASRGGRQPKYPKKGATLRLNKLLQALGRCAESGYPFPKTFAAQRTKLTANGSEQPSGLRGADPSPPEQSGGGSSSTNMKRTSAGKKERQVPKAPSPVKSQKGPKTKGSPEAAPASAEWWQLQKSALGIDAFNATPAVRSGERIPDCSAGEKEMRQRLRAEGFTESAPVTPPNDETGDGPEGLEAGGVLRLWSTTEVGGMPLDDFRAPWDLDPI